MNVFTGYVFSDALQVVPVRIKLLERFPFLLLLLLLPNSKRKTRRNHSTGSSLLPLVDIFRSLTLFLTYSIANTSSLRNQKPVGKYDPFEIVHVRMKNDFFFSKRRRAVQQKIDTKSITAPSFFLCNIRCNSFK